MSSPSDSTYTSPSPPRANRWEGPPRTWQHLTEEERDLATSLDELRNRDLAVHLYNAFALKRRAAEFDVRSKENNDDDDDDEYGEANGFKPPRNWTAWPIESADVPREGEQIGPDDEDDIFTLKRNEFTKPSKELEDLLVATTLRFAKENFQKRESESEGVMDDASDEHVETQSELHNDNGEDSEDGADNVRAPSEPPSATTILRPVISADDERSRELLRPSIRHTLSKLDEVLMALHHARQTCQRFASQFEPADIESRSRASSGAPQQSGEEPASKVKKPRGRPRKNVPISTPNTRENSPIIGETDDPETWPNASRKTTRRGRPKKVYEKLEGETQLEYLTRVARIQKRPLPKFDPPLEAETSGSVSPRKLPKKSSNSRLRDHYHKRNLNLRDWSEVLGSAALVGFSPDVIARATQRCANLFGESMTMRTMIERPVDAKVVDHLVEYHPDMVPDLESVDDKTSFNSSEDEASISTSDTAGIMHTKDSSSVNRKSYYCPNTKCHANKSGFETSAKLLKHVKAEHKMSKKRMEELMIDSDDEMDGAVHVDRFLKPISGKRGWRGFDTRERKRERLVENSGAEGEDDNRSSDSETDEDSDEDLVSGPDSGDEQDAVDDTDVGVDADDYEEEIAGST